MRKPNQKAGQEDEIEVEIVELDIENNNNCNFDKLIILSGEQEQTVCGNNINDVRFENPVIGLGRIELIFTSDGSERANGFLIRSVFIKSFEIFHETWTSF